MANWLVTGEANLRVEGEDETHELKALFEGESEPSATVTDMILDSETNDLIAGIEESLGEGSVSDVSYRLIKIEKPIKVEELPSE